MPKTTESQSLNYPDFLDSDIVELYAIDSTKPLKIHKKLLQAKCSRLAEQLEKPSETASGNYIVRTSNATLAHFIEWAYTGNYTVLSSSPEPLASEEPPKKKIKQDNKAQPSETVDAKNESHIHPLVSHMHLLVFDSLYKPHELERRICTKGAHVLYNMHFPSENVRRLPQIREDELAVLDALKIAFTSLEDTHSMTKRLVHYAAWSLPKLRGHIQFTDLITSNPLCALRIMKLVEPLKKAPWPTSWEQLN